MLWSCWRILYSICIFVLFRNPGPTLLGGLNSQTSRISCGSCLHGGFSELKTKSFRPSFQDGNLQIELCEKAISPCTDGHFAQSELKRARLNFSVPGARILPGIHFEPPKPAKRARPGFRICNGRIPDSERRVASKLSLSLCPLIL